MLKKSMVATVMIAGLVGGLMACSPIEKFAKESDVAMYQGVTPEGQAVFLDPKSGEAIVACAARKEKALKECRTEVRNNDGTPTLYFTGTDKPVPGAKMVQTTTFVWKGSHCQTNDVGGQLFENCWPWARR